MTPRPRAAAALLLLLRLALLSHGFVLYPSASSFSRADRRRRDDVRDVRLSCNPRRSVAARDGPCLPRCDGSRDGRLPYHPRRSFAARSSQDENISGESLSSSLRVGIVGAGSVAFGSASLLASRGHRPALWSSSGKGTKQLLEHATAQAEETLAEANVQSTGEMSHEFKVRIAQSAEELVRYSEGVIFLALPVNRHKRVMEELAPQIMEYVMGQQTQQQLEDGEIPVAMHVIISSHASLGAVYLMQLLREERRRCMRRNGQEEDSTANADDFGVRITAWGTTAVTARKTSGTSVNVLTVREAVDICTVPSTPEDAWKEEQSASLPPRSGDLLANGYDLCTTLFGERFNVRKGGLLAISLSNLNPQNHLGIVLGNMSRMDPPPPPPPPPGYKPSNVPDTTIESWYQGQCITPAVGRLMEKLDEERIAIANALGIEVRSIFEHFSWSFHVPTEVPAEDDPSKMRPLTVSEMNQMMHHYLDTDVLGPSVPDSRYVLEDVPYGLALTVVLGRLVGIPATLHESGIAILSAMYGRDFMAENELLLALGIIDEEGGGDVPELEAWRKMAYAGCFGGRSNSHSQMQIKMNR